MFNDILMVMYAVVYGHKMIETVKLSLFIFILFISAFNI